jgi:hypothetical protein
MKKTLSTSNRYLKDRSSRDKALSRTVETSSAIEGAWVKRDAATGRFVNTKKGAEPCVRESSSSKYNSRKKT